MPGSKFRRLLSHDYLIVATRRCQRNLDYIALLTHFPPLLVLPYPTELTTLIKTLALGIH